MENNFKLALRSNIRSEDVKKELIEAIRWYSTLEIPEKKIIVNEDRLLWNNRKIKLLDKLDDIILYILTFIAASQIIVTFAFSGPFQSDKMNFRALLIIPIVIIIIVYINLVGKVYDFFKSKGDKIESNRDHINKDYKEFIRVVSYFDRKYFLTYWTEFFKEFNNLSYRLFYLVDIYGMESFLLADSNGMQSSISELIEPMMEDILSDIVERYREYHSIEKEHEQRQKDKVLKSIRFDSEIYNKNRGRNK